MLLEDSDRSSRKKNGTEKTIVVEEVDDDDIESNAKDTININNSLLANKMMNYMRQKNEDSGKTLMDLFGLHK